jgi:hypothetical protein
MLLNITGIVYAAHLDDLNGPNLSPIWTYRDPASKGKYRFDTGKLVLDLKAGADMYIQGVDGGVMFLTEPPDMDSFSIEMLVNVAVGGSQPPACQVGIVFFNKAEWAYSAWGPYNAGTDIRLEDCIGGSYRWRADAQIGIDVGDVAIDQDVFLKVVKTGDELEFFAKGNANDSWMSGGVDGLLGPHYTPGNYQVGMIAKSWGGSVDSTFEIDYFDIPEIVTAVNPADKLATTWATLKQ